jgi:hypothetical protein
MDTPVVFFIFRRPKQTTQVFEKIRNARPSTLFLVADGPRTNSPEEAQLTLETRRIVENIDWPCEVHRIYSNVNLGLRERILTGLDEVFSVVDRAIILEDDCLPSESFFSFCSELLEFYFDNEQVGVVSGFNFGPYKSDSSDYYFSRSPNIWGWGTWARTWKAFRLAPQVESWSKEEMHELRSTFSSGFQRSEFFWFMKIASTLNTWDVSFSVWIRKAGLVSAIPRVNLVSNIGFGSGATHTKFEAFDVQIPSQNFSRAIRRLPFVSVDANLERSIWLKRRLRWLTFPLSHPIDFAKRILSFLTQKDSDKN